MASPRTIARVASRIQQRVAYCLQFEISDPRATFVTVTKVEVSKDLRNAKIYWSTYGGPGERSRTEHMLRSANGFIRRQLGRVLETRLIPELHWVHDESIERAADVDLLIREALSRDEAIRRSAEELAGAGGDQPEGQAEGGPRGAEPGGTEDGPEPERGPAGA